MTPGIRQLKPIAACSALPGCWHWHRPGGCGLIPRPQSAPPRSATLRLTASGWTWGNSARPDAGQVLNKGSRTGGAPRRNQETRAWGSLLKAEGREGLAMDLAAQLLKVNGSQGEAAPRLALGNARAVSRAQPGP